MLSAQLGRNRMGDITAWTADLSVGNRRIDDQHKNLFRLGREALRLIEEDKDNKERAYEVLNDIVEAINKHFEAEEEMLARKAYPFLNEHKEEHRVFRARFLDLLIKYQLRSLDREVLIEIMRDWIINHVSITDLSCKEYFAEANG